MNFRSLFIGVLFLSTLSNSYADENQSIPSLQINGTVRFQYTHNDYLNTSGNKIDFSDAVLWLNYQKGALSGHLDYRVYQAYDKIAGIHYPVNAWLAYEVKPEHEIKIGLQPVPIGHSRYYSSAYNLTQMYRLGLEEINHWGLSYQYHPDDFNLSLAYFFANAGSHTGKSQNSSHYSSFVTSEPSFTEGTRLKENQSYAVKVDKTLQYELNQHQATTQLGASYLYNDLTNLKNKADAHRQVWTVFQNTQVNRFNFNFTFGGQKIDNKDQDHPNFTTFGFFDGYFNVANKGHFLATEVNYTLPYSTKNWSEPKLYTTYSRYFKSDSDYDDSERLIYGVYTKYKENFQFYLENIQAKNDVGFGSVDGFAQGKNASWNSMLFLSLGYYF
ncbi:hypothetical protein [Acinetobacter shaoyimingii]|uniref:Uncharacterized protein n=1 Tax=Acinetobacter shaoyimingii TaxID=2715164 RepID=A0A6G8RW86_9GAMM|nr:hypothetical protein [Acinetobacter shaoyimingii]QIO06058.1 hypothetical protein G8E00_08880 [Acinetobacter shaoyimingii]